MRANNRSRILVCLSCMFAMFFSVFSGSPGVSAAEPGQIINVQYEFVPGSQKDTTRRMIKKRITKFDHLVEAPSYEVFYINWDAAAGIGAGASVIFEYRQGRSKVNQVVKFKYPAAVNGQKRTTFNVPLAFGSTGRVTAWRARIAYDQRVLSTRVSPKWAGR